jgi:predicted HicB family RNase H-like nuclease
MGDRRESMLERNANSKSKLSAWIPKQVHKRAKILATARDIDLQDLVAIALQDYLTDSEPPAPPCSPPRMNSTGNGENSSG